MTAESENGLETSSLCLFGSFLSENLGETSFNPLVYQTRRLLGDTPEAQILKSVALLSHGQKLRCFRPFQSFLGEI